MNSGKAPNVRSVEAPGRHTVFSMCGMCATRCPIEVTVEDGRVTWLQGNSFDPAIGASLCARGAGGIPLEYDDERPQTPLIRTAARGAGKWRRASWDEALDYIAEKLREVVEEMGPRGIALSDRGGAFTDLTQAFVQALGSPNYFDHDASCGRNAHNATRSLYGVGRTAVTFDLKNARHVVLYGRNIVESLQVKESKAFMAAMARGMRCTYIDPRASITACKATRYWQTRPNSDYALNLAIIHEVLKQEVYDKEFVARFVSGMDALREAVKDTSPEWQEEHTGIPAAEIRAFVTEIAGDAPHVIFHPGWMTARHKQSFYVSRTALILNALMGSVEVKGGIVLAKSPEDVGRKSLRKLVSRMPKAKEPRVDGAGTTHPQWDPASGILHQLFAAMESAQPYGVGAYFTYRHDPLTSMPDPEATKRALDKLKLLVSIDVRYSETAWFADVILPESSYLERANILAQNNGPRPNFGMRDQALAPRFDSRPAWWIFREILRRVGLEEALDFETIEELWDFQLEGTGVTVAQMREKGIVSLAATPAITPREQLKFKTPSGKIEIESEVLKKAGLPSLAPFQPHAAPSGDRFHLLFGRPAVLTHGQSLNNPILNEIAPEQLLWIHPLRARPLGISDGDEVEIGTDGCFGEGTGRRPYSAYLRARVTPWIHPDAVFMLHGYGATVPLATRACGLGVADQSLQQGKLYEFDPAGGGNAMTETVVQVRRKAQRGVAK
ncbi:MAG: molybdopterin-dependent oxidoreductase [Rhodocyclaceae bacterium]|nr:molybdopterin-dependent oxidoreductase [Rhodocyclaceae bacterium]